MKKLFVSLMAIAALVSCSKEEEQGIALDSKNKTIEITIANAVSDSRAGTVGGNTAAGSNVACANATDLKILFADKDGNILNTLGLTTAGTTGDTHNGIEDLEKDTYVPDTTNPQTAGTYIWHNVPWRVTQIAVVRTSGTEAAAFTTLKQYSDLASNESENIERGVNQIVLYADAKLEDKGVTHRVDDIIYHVWEASVRVAPKFARFEINNIQCADLGNANKDVDEKGNPVLSTYGFDELVVKSLIWNDKYTPVAGFAPTTLYGSYVSPLTDEVGDDNTFEGEGERSNAMTASNGVWSWNILPQDFTGLVLGLEAYAYDYAVPNRNVPLNVTGLQGLTTEGDYDFAAENIYTLNLEFNEENIIDPEGLCVKVTVTIAPWKVNVVTPVFSKPAAAPAE